MRSFIILILLLQTFTYAIEEKYLNIEGQKVFFRMSGKDNRTPLIMIHALGMSSKFWENNIKELSRERKVYAFDLPGFGRSGNNNKKYTINSYVQLLNDFIKHQNINKVILAGNGLGGTISILFSIRNPDKTEKLILVDSAGGKISKDGSLLKLLNIPIIGDLVFVMRDKNMIRKSLRSDVFYDENFVTEDIVNEVGHGARDLFLFLLRTSPVITDELPKIKCPTLIIWGDKDTFYPIENAHIFKEKIPDSRLVTFSEAGICPQIERKDIFNDIVLEFIKSP